MLINLWPNFLQDIVEFQQIARAEQPEFDRLEEIINEMHNEFSIFTVSEYGCGRWEKIMGIIPPPGDTLENRRKRLLAKYMHRLPYTYRSLLQYLSQITPDFTVKLDPGNYFLKITVEIISNALYNDVVKILRGMIPCNLTADIENMVKISSTADIFVGGTPLVNEVISVTNDINVKVSSNVDMFAGGAPSVKEIISSTNDTNIDVKQEFKPKYSHVSEFWEDIGE